MTLLTSLTSMTSLTPVTRVSPADSPGSWVQFAVLLAIVTSVMLAACLVGWWLERRVTELT